MSDQSPQGSRRGAAAAILVIALLVGMGLWLSHRLGHASATQDCVSTGRHDCEP